MKELVCLYDEHNERIRERNIFAHNVYTKVIAEC